MATTSLRSRMCNLQKGDTLVLNAGEHPANTVRNYASEIGFRFRRKLSVSMDRENYTLTVKRLS